MKPEILSDDFYLQLKEIGRADVVVGVPSYNNAKTIGKVAEMIGKGLARYYPDLEAVIINSDGGSTDSTRQAFMAADVPPSIKRLTVPYQGVPGKGSALKTVFEAAEILGVKMCLVMDSDTRSIQANWVKALIDPMYLHSYGYVTPHYLRNKHDGTITNSLAYPLTRALFGLRIRQPIGGDFGLSGGLVLALNHQRIWQYETDVNRFGIDIWMTTIAIAEGFRVCQTSLGAKIHDAKDPGTDLGPMFLQVMGTLFRLIKKYKMKWKHVHASKQVEILGDFHFIEVEEVKVSFPVMVEKFKAGALAHKGEWKIILSEENYRTVMELTEADIEFFSFPVDLWARIVYDYAVSFSFDGNKDEMLNSMIPLYYGRTAAFVIESKAVSEELADAVVDGIAGIFERMKPYLIKRWAEAEEREKQKAKLLKPLQADA
ncbi:MAG: hypothetical protein QMD53_06720 [Actinomycetota bacterium]|nr:hypothetical protein [Actinomycetota bacterium]